MATRLEGAEGAGAASAAPALDEIMTLVDGIPKYREFPTVDEMTSVVERLHSAYPKVTQLRRIGSSRLGEALRCLTVGSGKRHALIFAMPHPNEPIGALTAGELARQLCEDTSLRKSLNFTWHIIPCIDPDGTRLNEGWFKGPFIRSHYARHFYRPGFDDQPEWTFPFSYKRAYFDRMLPETVALMRLIDEIKPALMSALHNGETGGVYYYLSRPAPELYSALREIPTRLSLPLDLGEPEVPYTPVLAPGIYLFPNRQQEYDYLEKSGRDPLESVHGESSSHYASRYETLSIVSELPYWALAADDRKPSGEPYEEVLRRQADDYAATTDTLREALARAGDQLTLETPFLRASRSFIEVVDELARSARWRASRFESGRIATAAEVTTCAGSVHMYRTRVTGMLVRAFDAQVNAGLASPSVRSAHGWLAERFKLWCEAADSAVPQAILPLWKLVGTQFGAIVAGAAYLDQEAANE